MRLLGWIVGLPAVVVAVAFAVANRDSIDIRLDPLPFVVEIPVYAIALGGIAFGFLLGAGTAWLKAHKWRRLARQRRRRLSALEREAAGLRQRLESLAPAGESKSAAGHGAVLKPATDLVATGLPPPGAAA